MTLLLDPQVAVKPVHSVGQRRMAIPLALSAESWLHLRSRMRIYTIDAKIKRTMWRPELSYIIPLTGAISLIYPRKTELFSRRVRQGSVWPIQVRREGWLLAHTAQPIEVGWLLASTLRQVMAYSAELRQFFIQQMLCTQADAAQELLLYTVADAKTRLVHLLLALDADSAPEPIRCTHETLALLINLRRETVSHLIASLRREGLVKTDYRRTTLCNRQRLRDMLAGL